MRGMGLPRVGGWGSIAAGFGWGRPSSASTCPACWSTAAGSVTTVTCPAWSRSGTGTRGCRFPPCRPWRTCGDATASASSRTGAGSAPGLASPTPASRASTATPGGLRRTGPAFWSCSWATPTGLSSAGQRCGTVRSAPSGYCRSSRPRSRRASVEAAGGGVARARRPEMAVGGCPAVLDVAVPNLRDWGTLLWVLDSGASWPFGAVHRRVALGD